MYEREYSHFAAIASLLLAGDIQARVVSNPESASIEVKLSDGAQVLWSNGRGLYWSYSIIRPNQNMKGDSTEVPIDASAEEVARHIALFDYPAPPEFPLEHPGDATVVDMTEED